MGGTPSRRRASAHTHTHTGIADRGYQTSAHTLVYTHAYTITHAHTGYTLSKPTIISTVHRRIISLCPAAAVVTLSPSLSLSHSLSQPHVLRIFNARTEKRR